MTKEQQRNMYIAYIVVGVIVIIVIIAWAVHVHRKNEAAMQATTSMESQPAMSPTPSPTATTASGTNPAAASTYGQEVAAHPYRIQFVSCHGTPGTMQVAKGDVVMLDNRDAKSHVIEADSQTFTIPGYGWVLLHTSAVESSNVTCDGGGAAVLNVQK